MTAYGVAALAFGAHPDDVELFCGGTLIRLAELGHTTGVVDLTRGEKASHGDRPSTPGLVDPIRHLRDNPFPEAHAFEPLVP
jgi:LmbE family N-acetylglucosaminyl deacetylase